MTFTFKAVGEATSHTVILSFTATGASGNVYTQEIPITVKIVVPKPLRLERQSGRIITGEPS